jgi:hypothetical protein
VAQAERLPSHLRTTHPHDTQAWSWLNSEPCWPDTTPVTRHPPWWTWVSWRSAHPQAAGPGMGCKWRRGRLSPRPSLVSYPNARTALLVSAAALEQSALEGPLAPSLCATSCSTVRWRDGFVSVLCVTPSGVCGCGGEVTTASPQLQQGRVWWVPSVVYMYTTARGATCSGCPV